MTNQNKLSLVNFVGSSRSYLILVVSLIVLICLFVALAITSQTIESLQRWILIVFVILFAVLGLSVSVWLILRQERQNEIGRENRGLGWKPSSSESQRRRLEVKLRELAVALKNPDVALSDLFSAHVVAEDLAFRQIQHESKETLLRHQTIGGADFDAVLFKQDIIVCIETVFLVLPEVPQAKINEMLKKIAVTKKSFEQLGKNVQLRLLLILITQLDHEDEAILRTSLVQKFSATPVDVDIRLFDFENLQKIYEPV